MIREIIKSKVEINDHQVDEVIKVIEDVLEDRLKLYTEEINNYHPEAFGIESFLHYIKSNEWMSELMM